MFMRPRDELLQALGRMGPRACAYNAGGNLEAWLRGPCDCKYGGEHLGTAHESGNGCPELRSLYALIDSLSDEEYYVLVARAGGHVIEAADEMLAALRAVELADRLGEAIVAISGHLADQRIGPEARIRRAQTVIAGLAPEETA